MVEEDARLEQRPLDARQSISSTNPRTSSIWLMSSISLAMPSPCDTDWNAGALINSRLVFSISSTTVMLSPAPARADSSPISGMLYSVLLDWRTKKKTGTNENKTAICYR